MFFVMATKCTKCGKLVSQFKRRHRCRSKVESVPDTEHIMNLALHMNISYDFDWLSDASVDSSK